MELKWKLHQYTFKPAAYGSGEVKAIMSVKRGTWVKAVAVRIGEAFNGTTPTITIGDVAGAANGFVADADVTEETPALYPGYGTYFSATNGHLYTDDDTIDLTFAVTGGSTGLATVYILYAETE